MIKPFGVHSIAAVGLSGQIGLNGRVPWHGDPAFAEYTKADLTRFADMTAGGVLVMGSTTAESLPPKFRKGDRDVVVWTRRLNMSPVDMLENIRANAPHRNIWVCGGQKVYELFAPLVDWHHVSVIPYDGPADRFLPPIIPVWSSTYRAL